MNWKSRTKHIYVKCASVFWKQKFETQIYPKKDQKVTWNDDLASKKTLVGPTGQKVKKTHFSTSQDGEKWAQNWKRSHKVEGNLRLHLKNHQKGGMSFSFQKRTECNGPEWPNEKKHVTFKRYINLFDTQKHRKKLLSVSQPFWNDVAHPLFLLMSMEMIECLSTCLSTTPSSGQTPCRRHCLSSLRAACTTVASTWGCYYNSVRSAFFHAQTGPAQVVKGTLEVPVRNFLKRVGSIKQVQELSKELLKRNKIFVFFEVISDNSL